MADAPLDPLLLGQRVVAILETGQRTATYKLALLMALIEHCIENLPERPGSMVTQRCRVITKFKTQYRR